MKGLNAVKHKNKTTVSHQTEQEQLSDYYLFQQEFDYLVSTPNNAHI